MLLTTLVILIGLSVVIISHEAGHFFAAKYFRLKVDEFGFGFPPRIFSWQKGETKYSVNGLPFGGFVKIAGENGEFGSGVAPEAVSQEERSRYFFSQSAWRRSVIILAGVLMNFLLGWFLFSAVGAIGTPSLIVIGEVAAGSPADEIGLRQGDTLEGFAVSDDFIAYINTHRGEEVTLSVRRGSERLTRSVVPRVAPPPGEGSLGVSLIDSGAPRQSIPRALVTGLEKTLFVSWFTLFSFGQLLFTLFTQGTLLGDVVGPVGIFSVASETSQLGILYLIQLIALISINLAVINLLPFPALDGGRFFMILVEKLKGSPISRKTEALVNGIGFAFLLSLMVVITIHDIGKWF